MRYLIILSIIFSSLIPSSGFVYKAGTVEGGALANPLVKQEVVSQDTQAPVKIKDGPPIPAATVVGQDKKEQNLSEQKIVTAYSPREGCDDSDCIMASGRRVYEGAVACSRAIPLGTKIKVGENIYTCEDRLARRYDDRIDIFFEDYNEALRFGKQRLPVAVIE